MRRTPRAVGAVVLALALYATIWVGWRTGSVLLARVDDAALDFFYDFGVDRPGWVAAWNAFCIVFDPVTLRVVVLGLIGWEFYRRRTRVALFLLISVEGSALVTFVAKLLADRPRPVTALVHASGTSFPSGHALGDLVIVWALLLVYLPYVARRWRAVTVALGVVLIVAIGLARVILNVHHPSDIAAGWLLGYAYLHLCVWLVPPYPDGPPTLGGGAASPGSASRPEAPGTAP